VETGRQATPRQFWQHADAELDAGGVLLKAFGQIEDLLTEHRRQRQAARRQARYATLLAELRRYADLAPGTCPYGCAPQQAVVGTWTAQHVFALREAARLGVAELATTLGVTAATVRAWQRRTRLAAGTQRRLDDWLNHAKPEVHQRFRELLSNPGVPQQPGRTDYPRRRR
jgi:hypothetical protein